MELIALSSIYALGETMKHFSGVSEMRVRAMFDVKKLNSNS